MTQFICVSSDWSTWASVPIGKNGSEGFVFEVEATTHFPEMVVCESVGSGAFVG
jgi:hypothetical protein